MDFDRNVTLLEALGDEAEHLADEIPLQLMQKKLRKINPRELLFLLQRNIALEVAAPLAVEILSVDSMVQAGGHPGDLLVALMEANSAYWRENYELWGEVIGLLEGAVNKILEYAGETGKEEYANSPVGDDFMAALMHFKELFTE